MGIIKKTVKIIVPIVFIALAMGVGVLIIKSTKKPERTRPPRTAYAVDVVPLKAGRQVVKLRATGTVIPSTAITLRSRVSGEIIDVSPEFIAGGRYQKGDPILKIDPVDYQAALEQRKAALAEAEFQLKLEAGQSSVAAREWELMAADMGSSETDRELALRVPHLKYRTAKRDAAKADLSRAVLDLERTEIRAPFNAIVVERSADLGTQASLQDALAILADADLYYVRASVPVDRLRWIQCDPQTGSEVSIIRGTGAARRGRVVRLESALEQTGRMARVLIAVEHPMIGASPMLLNEYVHVEIQGTPIDAAYRIPREALHDDGSVWLVSQKHTLDIREVDVVWRDAMDVIISGGVKDDDRLILSNLSTPIRGMELRISGDPMSVPASKGAEKGKKGIGKHER